MTAPAQWRITGGVRHAHAGGGKVALCGALPAEGESATTAVCRVCMRRFLEAADGAAKRKGAK